MRSIVLTLAVVAGLAPVVATACPLGAESAKTTQQTVQDGTAKDAVKTDKRG